MTPAAWEAMSWHQRLGYLRNLTTYEDELRRLSNKLHGEVRRSRAASDTPWPDPHWTQHTARQMQRTIVKDPPEVIRQRIEEWMR